MTVRTKLVALVLGILLLTLCLRLPMTGILQSVQDTTEPPHSLSSALFNDRHLLSGPCSDKLCTQFLNPAELEMFKRCPRQTRTKYRNGTCRFMNGASRRVVAFASFPGSGNTWVRGLLERATGVCTGSVYCDSSLRSMGFNGEGVSSSAVLAVKTHESPKPFDAAIHIVRCPADAIVSEWNRKQGQGKDHSKHTAQAPPETFGNNEEWEEFLKEWCRRWSQAAIRLASYQQTHPILRVFYEDLKANTTEQVMRMLDFLQVPYSHSDVQQQLSSGFETVHRQSSGPSFEHFTEGQRLIVAGMLYRAIRECSKSGYQDTKDYIQKYLLTCIKK